MTAESLVVVLAYSVLGGIVGVACGARAARSDDYVVSDPAIVGIVVILCGFFWPAAVLAGLVGLLGAAVSRTVGR